MYQMEQLQDFEVVSVHHLYNKTTNEIGGRWNVKVGQTLDGNTAVGLNVTNSEVVGFSWLSVREKQTGK